ncbi:MAG: hypothetical protein AAF456_07050 [Planctomycetota bacterium]
MFFKSSPNLADNEKARIEFQLQLIADHIGFDRMLRPVVEPDKILALEDVGEIKQFVGEHLGHDVSAVKVQTLPMQPRKVKGGGG